MAVYTMDPCNRRLQLAHLKKQLKMNISAGFDRINSSAVVKNVDVSEILYVDKSVTSEGDANLQVLN